MLGEDRHSASTSLLSSARHYRQIKESRLPCKSLEALVKAIDSLSIRFVPKDVREDIRDACRALRVGSGEPAGEASLDAARKWMGIENNDHVRLTLDKDLFDIVVGERGCGNGREDSESEEAHHQGPTGFPVPPNLSM